MHTLLDIINQQEVTKKTIKNAIDTKENQNRKLVAMLEKIQPSVFNGSNPSQKPPTGEVEVTKDSNGLLATIHTNDIEISDLLTILNRQISNTWYLLELCETGITGFEDGPAHSKQQG